VVSLYLTYSTIVKTTWDLSRYINMWRIAPAGSFGKRPCAHRGGTQLLISRSVSFVHWPSLTEQSSNICTRVSTRRIATHTHKDKSPSRSMEQWLSYWWIHTHALAPPNTCSIRMDLPCVSDNLPYHSANGFWPPDSQETCTSPIESSMISTLKLFSQRVIWVAFTPLFLSVVWN